MNVSIFYRSATVWNIILFLWMSFLFLYLQRGLLETRTVFDQFFLKEFILGHLPFLGLLATASYGVFSVKKSSKFLFLACAATTVGLSVENLWGEFSKLITIALFFYTLTSYYFYQFLAVELKEAYYNSSYKKDDLFEPNGRELHCELIDLQTKSVFTGRLSNWDPNGCFVFLEDSEKNLKPRRVQLNIEWDNNSFEIGGLLASKAADGRGFGFKLDSAKEDKNFGWKELYSIIDQMGYNVELLK